MKKKTLFLPLLLGLTACANNSTSSLSSSLPSTPMDSSSPSSSLPSSTASGEESDSSSTSSVTDQKEEVSFAEALSLLSKVQKQEKKASKETLSVTATSGDIVREQDQSLTLYADGSSYGTGTVKETNKGKVTNQDTLRRRSLLREEKIETDSGAVADFSMFYQVVDYEEDRLGLPDYSDSRDRIFVFDSDREAQQAGLASGEYILTEEAPLAATFQHVGNLYQFIASELSGSPYVEQAGVTSMEREVLSDSVRYSTRAEYELDGDINNVTTYVVEASFTLDSQEEKLLSYTTLSSQEDVRNDDPEDSYLSQTKTEATLEYGTREEVPSTDPMDVLDYYLQQVTSIQLTDSYGEELDPTKVSPSVAYLRAKPLTYEPEKAILDQDLVPYASSDHSVVSTEEEGYFEVVGTGDTTLTFAYFGMEDGVWKNCFIDLDIHIVSNDPVTSVTFESLLPERNQLALGKEYTFRIYVSPSTAEQGFDIECTDPSVLSVTKSEDGESIIVKGLKEGEATVTVSSTFDPSKKSSETFSVYPELTSEETKEKIVGKSFFYESLYGYSYTMVFEDETTGYMLEETKEESYTDPFTYSVDGRDLTLQWTEYEPSFTKGYLGLDGTYLSFDDEENYRTLVFDLVEDAQ